VQSNLRLLLVEDQEHDATLIVDQLRREGFEPEWRRVDSEADFLAHLKDGPDIVLSEYSLPSLDGATALRLLRERFPEMPCIVISGTIGEERATEIIRLGADDYLLKDRLQRLGAAVTQAIRARKLRREYEDAQRSLGESEQRYRTMFERTQFALSAGGIGIWDWEAKTGRAHWSETLERIHGLAPLSFGGGMAAFLNCIHADDRPAMQAEIERALAERRDAVLEYRAAMPDGSTRLIACRGRFFRDESGEVVSAVGIGIDVSERHQLEAQLVQAQKMEAIGQLAGGIAHDFNNLLTAILGYAELLVPVVKHDERQRADLEEIRKAAVRATRLTGQLLAFSRRQILQPAVIDLNALVTEVAALLGRLIGEDIGLTLELDPSLGRTKADPGQIEQVIVNLAINARDAMPSGGALTIQTMNLDVDDQFFRRHGFANEGGTTRFVALSISDTGTGIDPAVKKRIFEPFFTTKPKGKGTGLGLATVYGIVKQSGGSIWVYSEPGQGATFKVYLPRTDQPVAADAAGTPSPGVSKGTETILLVEDEDAVRMLSQALLERQGYRVLVAASAEEATNIAGSARTPIHLLVTDVVMPGESGPELFEHLHPLRPEMRVLFLSGYTDDAIVRRGVLKAGTPFLQKPFTATALSMKVRELLDGGGPQP
jgi:hypothetical protein